MSEPTQAPLRIARDTFVVLDYALHDEDGDVIEATDDEGGRPIGFVFGYGTLVPGLEARLVGMAAGETREVVVPPEEGYGGWDEEKEFWVDRAELPEALALDDELDATDEAGDEITMRVVEIGDDAVLVDANHPLAGETLYFDVIVRAVRAATPEELFKTKASAPRPRLAVLADGPARDAPGVPPPSSSLAASGADGVSPDAPHALQPASAAPAAAPSETAAARDDDGVRTGRRPGKLTDDEQ